MNELRFDGRVAIVTGGGRGVGRCHALLLASRGARVVVADYGGSLEGTGSSSAPADEVVRLIKDAGGQAVASHASVAEPDGAESIIRTALHAFGRLDIVINNAGISAPELFEDLTLDDFRRMVDVHYLGTVHVCKAAWEHLRKAGYGRIVNTCSEGMLGFFPMMTSYGGAKGGVFGLTRSLAAEGPKYGILVNGFAPRANTRLGSAESVAKVFNVPVGALGDMTKSLRPEFASPAAVFLAHDTCRLNGELRVAGGGQVQRIILQMTQGIGSDALTPEFVAENLDAILDSTNAQLIGVNPDIRMNA